MKILRTRRDITSRPRVTYACVASLAGMIVLYLYFLNMSVVQVVMRTQYISEQRDLQAEIAMLDAEYIKAQHAVAARIATLDDGYKTDGEKVFVHRQQPRLVMQTQ